jgi:cytochrome c biogenesis protein CcmG, thiol:disulfide interchange protein DsbE
METITPKAKTSSSIFLAMIAGGLFLVGAMVIALLPGVKAAREVSVIPSTANYPAPGITLTDLKGKTVSLSDFSGQVILVNNWATWCPPCKAEMPALQAYYSKHARDGFIILGIESGESAEEVGKFVKAYKLTFPILLDPGGTALDIFNNYNLPSSYVIDRNGIIRLKWTGPISQAMLEKYVTPLLEK